MLSVLTQRFDRSDKEVKMCGEEPSCRERSPQINSRGLIFLSIDTNWQNALLTSPSPSAPPSCTQDEQPAPEIIPSLAREGRIIKALNNSAGTSEIFSFIHILIILSEKHSSYYRETQLSVHVLIEKQMEMYIPHSQKKGDSIMTSLYLSLLQSKNIALQGWEKHPPAARR